MSSGIGVVTGLFSAEGWPLGSGGRSAKVGLATPIVRACSSKSCCSGVSSLIHAQRASWAEEAEAMASVAKTLSQDVAVQDARALLYQMIKAT